MMSGVARARGGSNSFFFKAKLFVMVALILIDIGLNSSVEHDNLGMGDTDASKGTTLTLLLG